MCEHDNWDGGLCCCGREHAPGEYDVWLIEKLRSEIVNLTDANRAWQTDRAALKAEVELLREFHAAISEDMDDGTGETKVSERSLNARAALNRWREEQK